MKNDQMTAVILASGFSKRMGQNKLLLPVDGRAMILRVFETVRRSGFDRVVVVTSYETIIRMAADYSFQTVRNNHPEIGQSHSVVLGVQAALSAGGWMFFSGDMPWLQDDTVRLLLEQADDQKIVVPTYDAHPGQPVYFPAVFREELLALQGDHGGRTIIRSHPEAICYVPVESTRQGMDIDTPESYEKVKRGDWVE